MSTSGERNLARFTTADAETLLGRPLTRGEERSLVKTLEHSSLGEVFAECVDLVVADSRVRRTFEVTVETGEEVDVEAAMAAAMLHLCERVWHDCEPSRPWSISTTEDGRELDSMSYSFIPERLMGTFLYSATHALQSVAEVIDQVEKGGIEVHTITLVLNGQHGDFDLVVEGTCSEEFGVGELGFEGVLDHRFEGVAHRSVGVSDFQEVST